MLTSFDRRSDNVVVKAIIVPELKLRNVERYAFPAYLVERADDAAFEDRPKALNRLSVNGTDDILLLGMVNGACGKVGTRSRKRRPSLTRARCR
jgi:hypothetical protein